MQVYENAGQYAYTAKMMPQDISNRGTHGFLRPSEGKEKEGSP